VSAFYTLEVPALRNALQVSGVDAIEDIADA
jgi:hypothetical protein